MAVAVKRTANVGRAFFALGAVALELGAKLDCGILSVMDRPRDH
jgi:hypothetical protein